MASYSRSGIKKPRPVVYKGTMYPSLNAFAKWARSQGYKVHFSDIRLALDIGRNLDDVLAGKPFARKSPNPPITYQGVQYVSMMEFYRSLQRKHKKLYLTKEGFRGCIRRLGLEAAVHRLTHPRITNCSISRDLGGSDNLVLLRLKHGWSYQDAIRRPARKVRRSPSQ